MWDATGDDSFAASSLAQNSERVIALESAEVKKKKKDMYRGLDSRFHIVPAGVEILDLWGPCVTALIHSIATQSG